MLAPASRKGLLRRLFVRFGEVAAMAGWGFLVMVLAAEVRAADSADRPSVFVALPPGYGGAPEGDPGWAVANEVLVRFKPAAARQRQALARDLGGEVRWLVPRREERRLLGRAGFDGADGAAADLAVVRLPRGADLLRGIEALSGRDDVVYAEPNLRLRLCVEPPSPPAETVAPPSDFEFGRQWSLRNTGQTGGKPGADIKALEAWTGATGSRDIVAAIIDTGVDFFHPDLEANIWTNTREIPGNGVDDDGNGYIDDVHGYDFVGDDGDPMDDNIHGTHVAGILGAAGNDENGIAGVAWSVGLMALKAFDESGSGTLDDTLAAIDYAVKAGARVINASWGTTTRSRALDEVVAEAVKAGVVFVAAAGNNGSDVSFHPAAVPEALAVGATDANDRSPTFSNFGSFVDLVAPGDAIHSTAPNAMWTALSGTSMAAPHVSGLAVLLLSIRPEFTPQEIASILRSTTDELVSDRFTGAGRIHAGRAVQVTEPLPTGDLGPPSVLSGRVDVPGRADGHRFAGYRLEIGSGSRPAVWEILRAGDQPVPGPILLPEFDTSRFDDGAYTLRLVVSNALGQASIRSVPVAVRNVRLATPSNNDVRRGGDRIEIRGTVFGDGRTYELSWGVGHQPTQWSSTGFEMPADGTGPVVDGWLGVWDSSVAGTNVFVTLRLEARRDGRRVGEALARAMHLESRLRPGFPLRLPFDDEFPEASWREFNVADLDGDGPAEIVLVEHGEPGGRPPRLRVVEADGRIRWTRDLPSGAPEFDAPVVGDLDGDGRAEILVDTGSAGQILGFDSQGNPLGSPWPVVPGGSHFGKILADLDGDGRLELVAVSNPPPDLVGTPRRSLVVITSGGTVLRRWTLGSCDASTLAPEQLPAVANLDDDDELEIVAVDGCLGISAFDLSKEDGPLWSRPTDSNLFASPVVADLEGDGREEIVIGGVSRERGLPGGLYVLENDGRIRKGWPVLTQSSFPGSAALGDLDGDGRLEMIVADWDRQTVHAVRSDGFEAEGWPLGEQVNAGTRSVPIVADIDGDGGPEVILASPGSWMLIVLSGDTARAGGIKAWRRDGRMVDLQPGIPAEGLVLESIGGASWHRLPPPVLTDLDGNGRLDIVAATIQDRTYSPTPPISSPKMRSTLYAWELPVPFRSDSAIWPAFQGGPRRAGRLHRPPPPNRPPVLLDIPDQTVATGDDFRPIRLDRYASDPDGRRENLRWEIRGGRDLVVELDPLERVLRVKAISPGWEGRETLELLVRDAKGAEATDTVTFAARVGYRPPVARPDVIDTLEEVPVEFSPLANDSSPTARPLRLLGVSAPGAGRIEVLPSHRLRYEPAPDAFGDDTFEYTIIDDDGGSATAEVTVRVAGVDDPPVAEPDRLLMDEDTGAELSLLANDHDPDGDSPELVAVDTPEHGTLSSLGDGRFWFVPRPDWYGFESFGYRIRDPSGLVSTGEVSVLVQPVNDPPVARDQTVKLNRNRAADVFYDAVDVDGDSLQFTVLDGPTNGVLLAYPTLANYEPRKGYAGVDRFTYRVSDGRLEVGPMTVHLAVLDANNPPDVEGTETVTAENQELTIGLRASDADGDAVTLRLEEPPAFGSVTLQGTNAIYRPATDYVGMDRFTFRARDELDESEPAAVNVRVTDQNTPPVALSEVLTVARNQLSPIRLRATDGENNPLRFLVVTPPALGTLEGDPPEFGYRPRPNFRGLDRFEYAVSDGRSTSELAVIHLLVRDPNQAPRTTNQTVLLRPGETTPFRLEAVDPDGHPLRAVILDGPRFGRVFGMGVDFNFRPNPGFEGMDTFTYKVWDGFAYGPEASVTVLVQAPPPVPVGFAGVQATAEGLVLLIRGTVGTTVRLEFSEDLRRWETADRVILSGETTRWLDPVVRESRFYRLAVE